MPRISTEGAALLMALALGGCATSKDELLPHGQPTMREVWNQETGGGGAAARRLREARLTLRRPLTGADAGTAPAAGASCARAAASEIPRQFHRLPDPDLVMYVFPHLAGTQAVPVPGYTTVFPFYERVHYALPGDRLEDD